MPTPTPLKSQFNQIRPGEPLFNNTIHQAVNDFIANPNAGQFTNQNNFPFFDVITKWNVSQVTSMNSVFLNKTLFNDNISGWDVSNVLDMTSMFEGATSFNIDISKWVVNKVINMNRMFVNASSFNHTIQYWLLTPTAGVPTFENMLEGSGLVGNTFGLTVPTPLKSEFNQKRPGEPIFNDKLPTIVNDWIANPANLQFTDQNNTPYYDVINGWDVSQVTTMNSVFLNKTTFNNDISNWDCSNVLDMTSMFQGATAFNQNIGSWNVGNVQNMTSMFEGTISFTQNIGNWNVINVTNMSSMFKNHTNFNVNIQFWAVNNVVNMSSMFEGATSFNLDISKWRVFNVTNMNQMFKGATAFKQPLQFWQLIKTAGVPTFTNMFESSGMIGNTFGLTTPTPLKSQFDQKRPGEPIFNTTIHQLVDDWIADPTAAKWNDQNNTPYFDIIQKMGR